MIQNDGAGGSVKTRKAGDLNLNSFNGNKPTTSYALAPQPLATVAQQRQTQRYVAPIAAPAAVAPAAAPAATSSYSGGGSSSGGGGSAGTAAGSSLGVVAPIPSLSDYISKNYLLTTTDAENSRKMADYDAETTAGTQDTQADRDKRLAYLDQDLDRQGEDSAESFAARGLGRSGLVFQAQDKIDAAGEKSRDSIDQLVTDYLRGRTSGRLQQQAANRSARAGVIQQLTDAYNTAVGNGTADQLTTLSS